jgi:hypothetical protein
MTSIRPSKPHGSYRAKLASSCALAVVAGLSLRAAPAQAYSYNFNDGVVIRIDNDVEYSLVDRTGGISAKLAAGSNNINSDDGDRNLSHGIVSDRVQDVTTLDISDNGFGFDASALSFYDSVYESKTQNTSPYSVNSITGTDKFPHGTSALVGRNIEARNLFIFGGFTIGNVPVDVRIGRHTLVWGESLFFPDNGIAYGLAPFDGQLAASEPNVEAKDLFLPVGMASVSVQATNTIRVEAYYQFEWEKTIIPPAGSYYSSNDFFDGGGQRILAVEPNPFFPGIVLTRTRDIRGSTTGQFGAAVHYDPDSSPYDFGLYALQYNDRAPQVYSYATGFNPTKNGIVVGDYALVYPDYIQLYGASASTTVGPFNIAGEGSVRIGVPLTNLGITVNPGELADNNHHALYPKGNAAYQQISTIYLGPATRLWGGSALVAELAGTELLAVTKNGNQFVKSNGGGPGYWDAVGFHVIFTPQYYEIRPDTDLSVPIGLAYNLWGQSPTSHTFNGSDQNHGGVFTFGPTLTYRTTWNLALTYSQYFGPVAPGPKGPVGQVFADRSNVALSVQHTF